jgi:transposase-like protein
MEFVERGATPRLLMKFSIQLHLAGLSLSNTVSSLEVFSVERVRSIVHNGVHKANPQPESGRSPNHVAADETVIQLDGEQCSVRCCRSRFKQFTPYNAQTDKNEPDRRSVFHGFLRKTQCNSTI